MADLTDKEITEACARAMGKKTVLAFGIPHVRQDSWYDRDTSDEKGALKAYNPLTDRAQAMELQWWMISQGWCVSAEFDDRLEVYKTQRSVFSANRVDSEQAFRRAICLCAARVQIEKENGGV